MIQRLLAEIVARLRVGLDGAFVNNNIEDHIEIRYDLPRSNDLPFIALQPAALEVNTKVRDTLSSEVRPQQIVQEEEVASPTPATTYSLDQIPLENSVLCYVIYDQGEVSERKQLLVQGKDYIISVTESGPEVHFSFEIEGENYSFDFEGASHVQFKYSYAGVFTVREFLQHFFVNIYTDPLTDAEEWAALATTIILTNYDEIINAAKEFQNTESPYIAQRSVTQLLWTGSEPDLSVSPARIQLTFEAKGQFMAIREVPGDFGIIEKVRSQGGVESDFSVDINPQLG